MNLTEKEKQFIVDHRHWSPSKISLQIRQPRHVIVSVLKEKGFIDSRKEPIQKDNSAIIKRLYENSHMFVSEISEAVDLDSDRVAYWLKSNVITKELIIRKVVANRDRIAEMTLQDVRIAVGADRKDSKWIRSYLIDNGIPFKPNKINHDATASAPTRYKKVEIITGHPSEALGLSPSEYYSLKDKNRIAQNGSGEEFIVERSVKKYTDEETYDAKWKEGYQLTLMKELIEIEGKIAIKKEMQKKLNNEISILGSRRKEIRDLIAGI